MGLGERAWPAKGSGAGERWDARFRQASVARSGEPGEKKNLLDEELIRRARTTDPTAWLKGQGYTFAGVTKKEARKGTRSGSTTIRFDVLADGHWVCCYADASGIGDTVALVRELSGCGFRAAVEELVGYISSSGSVAAASQTPVPSAPPKMPPPPTLVVRELGRAYLRKRGISEVTIAHAEKTGMVGYAGKFGAQPAKVLFIGRGPDGTAWSITRRFVEDWVGDDGQVIRKLDITGSSKGFPAVLSGDLGCGAVWVVEGGVDALALHDIALRAGTPRPTVIVTGGASVIRWTETPHIAELLRQAGEVVIACDNDTGDTLARTTAAHERQAEAVRGVVDDPRLVRLWSPPAAYGDLADLNADGGVL